MPKTIEKKDESSTCSDKELLDLLEEAFVDAPSHEDTEMPWQDNATQNMASSSSAQYYTTETYETKSDNGQIKNNDNVSKDFEKFIRDEFTNNQQIYRDHAPLFKRKPHEGYRGFTATEDKEGVYLYSVFLPYNLIKGHFARFDAAIIAAVAHDFIVKAFDLHGSLLNFPTELYTAEKIQACRDILAPIIEKHRAIQAQLKINDDMENSIARSPLHRIEYEKIKNNFLQFINAFKEKNSRSFGEKALLDLQIETTNYYGVNFHRGAFDVSFRINNRKIFVARFTDKINAVIAHDFVAKILNLSVTIHFKDLYTEEAIIACAKIILPLLKEKIKLADQNRRLATKATAPSSSAAAAAAPQSTEYKLANTQQIDQYLELNEHRNPLTFAYGGKPDSAGSPYNPSETSGKEKVSRKDKKSRIDL